MRVLMVEQGRSRGVLAAVRSLARAGASVDVAAPDDNGFASWSRHVTKFHRIPRVDEDVHRFVDVIRSIATSYDIVFGGGEADVLALSLHRDSIAAVVPYPEHDVVVRAMDKQLLSEDASRAGIASPRTIPVSETSDLSVAVIKARMHADVERPGAPPRVDTNTVFGRDAIAERIEYVRSLGAVPVVQEYVRGSLLAYSAVLDRDGALLAASAQQASAIWPPHAGASCRARTVSLDPALEARCLTLLRSLGWFGLAELQFVVAPGREPCLIDLNGRFYGSLGLAIAAGADLPVAWARAALGAPVSRRASRPGVRYQWLEGDLRRAWVERRGGLLLDVATTLARAPLSHHSIWSSRDPQPGLRHLGQLVRGTATPPGALSKPPMTRRNQMADPKEILERSRTIAVVGASSDASKPSNSVPANLQRAGFNVIPVNPSGKEILGRPAVKSLSEIDEPIDVVEVFRPSEEAPEIAREAVTVGAKTLWLQLDIRSDEARRIAEEGGLDFIEDRCMGRERDRYDITKERTEVGS